jgi:hypothetical protein
MELKELDNIKIFFILGRPRSGTTLLRTLFDAHTNVSIPYEGRIIMDLYFKYGKQKKWTENKLIEFYNDAISLNKVKDWEFSENFKKDVLELGENTDLNRLIKIVYLSFKSLFPKEKILIIGDKNPFYSIRRSYLRIIREVFPEAKIIHLVRDYRAHYLSMTTMDFESNNVGVIALMWKYSYEIIKNEFGNSKNYLLIKHEDLTSHPTKYLTELCSFLNIEFQPTMLEFYKIKDYVLENYGDAFLKIHSSLLNPVTDEFNDKWKTKLDDITLEYLDAITGETADEIGYERKYFKQKNFFIVLYLHFFKFLYLFYARILDYSPLKIKMKIVNRPGFFHLLFTFFLKK